MTVAVHEGQPCCYESSAWAYCDNQVALQRAIYRWLPLVSLWLEQERTLLTSTLQDTANAVVESSCIRRFESNNLFLTITTLSSLFSVSFIFCYLLFSFSKSFLIFL